MQWNTKADNITTNLKVKVNFTLPKISATNIVIWKCHIDKSTASRYKIILGRDLLVALGLDLKCYENVVVGSEGPYEGCSAPMVCIIN